MDDRLFSVKDRIAVVTGGLGQLGAAFTNELLDRGSTDSSLFPEM